MPRLGMKIYFINFFVCFFFFFLMLYNAWNARLVVDQYNDNAKSRQAKLSVHYTNRVLIHICYNVVTIY